MTTGRKVAIGICIGLTIVAIISTIILKIVSPDNTLSKVVLYTSIKNPLLPLLMGIVIGHWVFPQKIGR